ncbi:MerR family transcriptional regulator [Thermoleophilia bacterium SCSIO 60948]|nr:MerR family transcriptional regulator [Thermoleophilia bacterium SCSIO 60948]
MAAESDGTRRVRRTRTRASFDAERGVFMISVAAELAEMHPQTLRMYEQRGLITPKRSPKNTRLYSQADVERLRRIQEMTDAGLNLTGVETVLALEAELEKTRRELTAMRQRAARLEARMNEELERTRALRAELVPYDAYGTRELVPVRGVRITRRSDGASGAQR